MKNKLIKLVWLLAVIIAIALLIFLFTGIVQLSMAAIAPAIGVTLSESTLLGASGTIGSGLAAVIIWLIIRYSKRLSFYHCPQSASTRWTIVYILFILAVCRIVVPGIWAYASYILGVKVQPIGNAPVGSLWEMILFSVILSPIFEELLFRKDLFSLLKIRFSLLWTIGLSAILFAAIHGYSLEGFVSCLIAGILFAILMARTGKVLPCIIAHILCNLESFFYNTTETTNPLIINLGGYTTYNAYIFAMGLIVSMICGAYIWRNKQTMHHR